MVTEREDKRGKPGDSWQLEQCRRFALLHKRWEEGVEAEEEGDREQAWAKVREFMAAASRTHTHTLAYERLDVKDRFMGIRFNSQ